MDSELSVDLAEGNTLAATLMDQGFSLTVRVLCTSAVPDMLQTQTCCHVGCCSTCGRLGINCLLCSQRLCLFASYAKTDLGPPSVNKHPGVFSATVSGQLDKAVVAGVCCSSTRPTRLCYSLWLEHHC